MLHKKGEDRTEEVEYQLRYIEEGRTDEFASYRKHRLRDYEGNGSTGGNAEPN